MNRTISTLTLTALASACFLGCSGDYDTGYAEEASDEVEIAETTDDALYAASGTLWLPNTTDGWTEVPVCWQDSGMASDKDLVKYKVRTTWEYAAKVRFTGWGDCASGARGIRISVQDVQPHTRALGRQIDGKKDGMVLNFTFNKWTGAVDKNGNPIPYCSKAANRTRCIEGIAAHEFGHALGIAHEQNRPDSPMSCKDDPQGTNGNLELGNFDNDSIMNYCNQKWNNDGNLSDTDKARIADLYGGVTLESYACFFPPCVYNTTALDGDGALRYGDLVAIGGRRGKYLRMDNHNDVKMDNTNILGHEKWTIVDPLTGRVGGQLAMGASVAFRSHTGKFLSATNKDGIGAASTIGPREIWEIRRPNDTLGGRIVDVGEPIGFWNNDQWGYLYDGRGNPKQSNALQGGETFYFRGPISD